MPGPEHVRRPAKTHPPARLGQRAAKNKGLKGSIDDVLGDLLGDDMALPEKPVELAPRARDTTGGSQVFPPSRAGAKSLLEGDFLSPVAGLAGADEVSDVSDADPQALLQAMKDMDDMDADLLGLKKSSLASSKTAAKGSGKEELSSVPKPVGKSAGNEKGDASPTKNLPPSSGSFGHQYRKFSMEAMEDPLAGLLSDDEEGTAKQPPTTESKTASDKSPSTVRDQGPSIPLTPGDTPVRKKEKLMFDEGDDLMASLGFGDNPKAERGQTGDQEGPRPARSKLDELLGRGTAAKLPARPGAGERRESRLARKPQRLQDKEDTWGDEDFTFGAYQPTMGSSEGWQSRRQSVSRFLAESDTDPKGDLGSRQSTPAAASPVHPRKGGADWLGLKDDDFDLLPPSATRETRKGGSALSTTSVPPPASRHSAPTGLPISGVELPTEGASSPSRANPASTPGASVEREEDDWLNHALSRKKSQALVREGRAGACKGSQPAASTRGPRQAASSGSSGPAVQDTLPARPGQSGSPATWKQTAVAPPADDPKRGLAPGDLSGPTLSPPSSQEPTGFPAPAKALVPEPLLQSRLLGSESPRQLLAAQGQLRGSTAELQAELLRSQARLTELEAQVRKLELERAQHTLLLEGLQRRHQADLELVESAHRSRITALEASYQQREERLRREKEELSARYLSRCQEAELAHTELSAEHQRRLAAAAQEKDREMERLRELQRASVLEMRKDHEDQVQRLKLLKDREIDAVTSATSHTRDPAWGEAAPCCLMDGRRQPRQVPEASDSGPELLVFFDHPEPPSASLAAVPNPRALERWRVSAEQFKAESAQRSLEEQRKAMVQQTAMEREELERAKSALLEEQKAVMHKCSEERRRLATEWAEFFAQQKLSKERAEREAERALQAGSQREDTLVSLAKEQAELKIRASELRAKEDQLAAEQEALERERQELQLEKERVNAAALRVRLRAEEVEGMSKVASEKYEAGERALCEARQVQSEHQARLRRVQQQQERLRQQEQHMHQEHLSLAQQRLQLDRVRQDLPSSLVGLLPRPQGPAAPSLSVLRTSAPSSPPSSRPPDSLGPSLLHARLVLLKHTAEKDRDFLEDEQFFLETLKNAPYNVTSHPARGALAAPQPRA
ncbi:fas-binding factor 1 [Orycteropus afer afer]|uniref:Fas-binding factor 1 n=1 Tax=Orycteropus afer afer TaxID=1230840 RepID=A0AC54ZC98_ORYAF|nr:fas-binding factor 1 [Orycteropus afer afer]